MKKLFLIDASGFIYRAYHALPPMTRNDGTPIGAVYGFVKIIMRLLEKVSKQSNKNDVFLSVIFDAGRKTFRNDLYSEYKAHRPLTPDDLIPQFAIVREAVAALNLPAIGQVGYEADDIIATYAKQGKKQGFEVVIVSSDKDLMQLIDDDIKMYDPMKQREIGVEEVHKKFGVAPNRVIDAQALIGDSSDNIPGVAGIGVKTAAELINQYGDLENLLANADEIPQKKRRETLLASKEIARLSYELVKLFDDVPLEMHISDFRLKNPDEKILVEFMKKQGFHSIISHIDGVLGMKVSKEEVREYELADSEEILNAYIKESVNKGKVAFDTETTSLNAMDAELVGFSLCNTEGKAVYVPLQHTGEEEDLLGGGLVENQIPLKTAINLIKPILEDESIIKIGHNIKYDKLIMQKYGVNINPTDDTMLMSYLLEAGLHNHNMDDASKEYLGIKTIAYKEIIGKKKSFAEVDLKTARDYAAEDADITMRLYNKLKQRINNEGFTEIYTRIEQPLIDVIVDMEDEGIKVDSCILKDLSNKFKTKIVAVEEEIYAIVGRKFNVASPKQLGEILFGEMSIPSVKKTKGGALSTSVEVLEELAAQGHTIADKILEHRHFSKLVSTYTDALPKQIKKGRIHTSFSMVGATTGRLSSSEPNLQNIPIRTDEGRSIRSAFIAEKGNKLISADYSQIELRILAHVADIPSLKQAFINGDDIHTITAQQIFGVTDVTPDLRRKAKTINFGIIYGISPHGLATRLGISRSEAKQYIDAYFEQYAGIKQYMDDTIVFAKENGYVDTLFGRRCHIKNINNKNGTLGGFAQRVAINAPIQGTAADIIKKAMVKVHKDLDGSDTKMLLQVHDELIFETPEAGVAEAMRIIKNAMETVASLSIPLLVDINSGDNWGEIH